MNNNDMHDEVVKLLHNMADDLQNGTLSREEADKKFKQHFSKEQLIQCLVSEKTDAGDARAFKEMLEYFFDYKMEKN